MNKIEQIEALRNKWKAKLSKHKKSGNIDGWNAVADVVNCMNLALQILHEPSHTQMQPGTCNCDPACVGWLGTLKGRICSVCGELRR